MIGHTNIGVLIPTYIYESSPRVGAFLPKQDQTYQIGSDKVFIIIPISVLGALFSIQVAWQINVWGEEDKFLYMVFIDLEKSYERVPKVVILADTEEKCIPKTIWEKKYP